MPELPIVLVCITPSAWGSTEFFNRPGFGMASSVVKWIPSAAFCVVRGDGLADVLALEEFDRALRDRSRSLPATEMLSKVGPMCEKILKGGRDTNREAGAQRIVEAIRAVDTGANEDTRARNVREEISKLYTREKTPDGSVDMGFRVPT
jgi:hypothetical protein